MNPKTNSTVIETALSGVDLIAQPLLNKGTAFTEAERDAFALHGILPPSIGNLDDQVRRRLTVLRSFATNFERYSFLRDLQDTNETLFYALLIRHIEELLPLVYTPTVGEGCQRFSEIWRRPRGLFLSYPNRHRMRDILADPRFDQVRVIVVSDGERILGLGDQGAGGMGISIGKLSLYTACAGIHPASTLPILLDVGTNNQERLDNPLYVGWRNPRISGEDYEAFVEEFVSCIAERFPNALLQWEDFAGANAGRLLARYRDRLCTFNDDIQGTAAVAAGTLMAAIRVSGSSLTEQRVVLVGAGAAGTGIAGLLVQAMMDAGLSQGEARSRFYLIDSKGLVAHGLRPVEGERAQYAQSAEAVADWQLDQAGRIELLDVVRNARPSVLIGVSGQAGAFHQAAVRMMAEQVARPIIFPLSNPTSRSEATPADLVAWTEGRALIGTGSPFPPVPFGDRLIPITQTNNSYIFPGVGLAVLAVHARRISDAMFMAAGRALAELSPARNDSHAALLPPVDQLREVAIAVAFEVARQAQTEGLGETCGDEELRQRIQDLVWEPVYRPYRRV
ncbi:NAD-dependent malic enzyme [Pseudomarimonas arenosa]|uniref:NAD-dependent malic enzyme n=1 Tax=Pseudomarimonas arenosa TaxID=2774145 RepID=A0AAW3ZVD0_9GAMM|nr:NAD-dependent malic enzyme [Pseudomarimonas arenosa]MBD8528247.1 NAD-dependent malic enzyme [Pseudomarimonas arenosa]